MTTLASFPNCCGIHVIQGFPFYPSKDSIKATRKTVEDMIRSKRVGIYLVTLNMEQKPLYHDMMKELGFEEIITDFYNPQHGSTVTMYGYTTVGQNAKPDIIARRSERSIFPDMGYW